MIAGRTEFKRRGIGSRTIHGVSFSTVSSSKTTRPRPGRASRASIVNDANRQGGIADSADVKKSLSPANGTSDPSNRSRRTRHPVRTLSVSFRTSMRAPSRNKGVFSYSNGWKPPRHLCSARPTAFRHPATVCSSCRSCARSASRTGRCRSHRRHTWNVFHPAPIAKTQIRVVTISHRRSRFPGSANHRFHLECPP